MTTATQLGLLDPAPTDEPEEPTPPGLTTLRYFIARSYQRHATPGKGLSYGSYTAALKELADWLDAPMPCGHMRRCADDSVCLICGRDYTP